MSTIASTCLLVLAEAIQNSESAHLPVLRSLHSSHTNTCSQKGIGYKDYCVFQSDTKSFSDVHKVVRYRKRARARTHSPEDASTTSTKITPRVLVGTSPTSRKEGMQHAPDGGQQSPTPDEIPHTTPPRAKKPITKATIEVLIERESVRET